MLEAYKWIFSILNVGTDVYLWGDTQRPRFVDIVGPYKKWGGDNADAFYQFAPDRSDPHLPGRRAAWATPSTGRSPCTADPTTAATRSASSAASTTATTRRGR